MSTNPDGFPQKPPDASLIISAMDQPSASAPVVTAPTLHQVGKHQMLPVVVIQTQPSQKLSQLSASTNNSMLTLPKILPMQQVNNQVVLGKTPIVLSKAASLPKNGVTYLTMLKPVSKPPDSVLSAQRLPITTITNMNVGKMKTESTIQVINNLNSLNSLNNPKIMITPMPSVTSNRPPVTMTTNSVQSKISFMPIVQTAQKGKIINLKLADAPAKKDDAGKLACVDLSTTSDLTITAVPDEKIVVQNLRAQNVQNLQGVQNAQNSQHQNAEGPQVAHDERSYELSIVEDEQTTEKKDVGRSVLKRFNPEPAPSQGKTAPENPAPTGEFVTPGVITQNADSKDSNSNSNSNSKSSEPAPPATSTPVTTKRSRKSTLCLRKDFHDIEVQISTKSTTLTKLDLAQEARFELEIDEINSGPDPFNFSALLDDDLVKIFDWKHSVGVLPGSDLRFFINEFGFLEYLTQEEFGRMQANGRGARKEEKAAKRAKAKRDAGAGDEALQEEMRCLECGCFGQPSEFISPKYCSADCGGAAEKRAAEERAKKKRRKMSHVTKPDVVAAGEVTPPAAAHNNTGGSGQKRRKVENGEARERDVRDARDARESSDDDSVRTDASSHEKYPWHCKTKGFSWSKYLAHINAIGAPVKLFKDAFPYNRNGFRPGMKLEGVDPQHPSYFCVLTVAAVQGYRLLLHFDGYPKNYDFWVNSDSMDIFPAGFCEKYDHVLHPPPNFPDFNWVSYLKHTKAAVAPKHLFSNRTGSAIFPTAFRVGMKLEAVDRKNTSLVCVATAKDLMDSRILVHFDSWDDIYDYWADPSSPYIHPVGWCDKNGHNLTPPNDYPDPENFTWEKYLKETNSAAAPVRAFKQRPPCGFRKGMRLEVVDKRVPQLIRVASVVDIKQNRLRVAFDGWPDRYAYWVDDDCPDIHPVGWCQKTGHQLEPPLTPDDVYDFMDCATIGCRGIGNMKGPVYTTHTSLKYCPYAEDNIDADSFLPDRLLSPDRELEAVVPVSREPRTKKTKKRYETNSAKTEWIDAEANDPQHDDLPDLSQATTAPSSDCEKAETCSLKIKSSNSTPAPSPTPSIKSVSVKKECLSPSPASRDDEDVNLEEVSMRSRHSKYFRTYAKCKTDPASWSPVNVVNYVKTLPFAKENADAFAKNAIDGDSFLMLTQEDLVDVLKFKLGPAIALYNCILFLRKNVIDV